MRGAVPDLLMPYPLAELLPAFLQADQFATRWTAGLDDVLAPVVSVLDCLEAYVDPALAPPDFARWLAEWVGAVVDENWAGDRQRRAIATAVTLHRARGTLAGLCAQLELATGGSVQIVDGGGVTWSTVPEDSFAAAEQPGLLIRITVTDPSTVSLTALDSIVDAAKPAHLPHTIEVVGS